MATFTIAKLVIREVVRRKLILALLALTVLAVALTGWGFSRIPTLTQRGVPIGEDQVKLIASQLLILVMFMFGNIIALSSVFIASPALSGDLESGVALSMLARPIARREYVLGKWLGLAGLVIAYAIASIAVELVAIQIAVGYLPPRPVEFALFLVGRGIVLLTFALLLSTRLSGMVGGVIALVLYGMAWLLGVVGGLGATFGNETIERVGTVSKLILPTDGLWRGAVYHLEPAIVLAGANAAGPAAAANPFYSPAPPPLAYLVWCVFWILGVLALAMLSFRRREA
ncbi:MAG: ABC transporter permease [Chloroflexi bacterium]|nr:ABC transporter permease [Chloroflexota bacterium]